MIIFKYKDDDRFIEINFCEKGLYIAIDDCESDHPYSLQNIVIDHDAIESLKKYLLENG